MSEATKRNLKELSFETRVAAAKKGTCYLGVAATGRDGVDFIIVAANADDVQKVWDKFMRVPMQRAKLTDVAVVAQENLIGET